jgi:hypothetical protein
MMRVLHDMYSTLTPRIYSYQDEQTRVLAVGLDGAVKRPGMRQEGSIAVNLKNAPDWRSRPSCLRNLLFANGESSMKVISGICPSPSIRLMSHTNIAAFDHRCSTQSAQAGSWACVRVCASKMSVALKSKACALLLSRS